MSFLFFIVSFSLLILVHEAGHFFAAKLSGIKVEEFGIGYPPKIFSFGKWRETEFTLNAIPFGGFARMLGEGGEDLELEGSFASKSKVARAFTLIAGSLMNFLLAIVLFTIAFSVVGWPKPTEYKHILVMDVSPDTPAARAGLMMGDVIVGVDGVEMNTPDEFIDYTQTHLGEEMLLKIERSDEIKELSVTPRTEWPEDQGPTGIAISPMVSKVEPVRYPLGESIIMGVQETAFTIIIALVIPVQIIRGLIPLELARPVGPVGIYQLTSNAAQYVTDQGQWFPILRLVGIISAALAITNLLPLPGLDGGRLIFVIIEGIRGQRIDPAKENAVHVAGFIILLLLMVLVTYYDLTSPLPIPDMAF